MDLEERCLRARLAAQTQRLAATKKAKPSIRARLADQQRRVAALGIKPQQRKPKDTRAAITGMSMRAAAISNHGTGATVFGFGGIGVAGLPPALIARALNRPWALAPHGPAAAGGAR